MTKQEANQDALKKFEEKYGFTDADYEVLYTERITDSVEKRDEINVYVPAYMDEGEKAKIYSWVEDGKALSEDNMFGYLIRDSYAKKVKDAIEPEFGEAKVYIRFSQASFHDALGKDATLEDAYEQGEKMIAGIEIAVVFADGKEAFAEKGEKVCSDLKNANLKGTVHLRSVTKEIFEKMDRTNYMTLSSEAGGYDPDGINILDLYRGKSY